MTIKELEKESGLSRSTIRFYEKQGLFVIHREGNGYRDYSSEDLLLLKKIYLFRMLGVSVEHLRELIQKQRSYDQILTAQRNLNHDQSADAALKSEICGRMQRDCPSFEQLEPEEYIADLTNHGKNEWVMNEDQAENDKPMGRWIICGMVFLACCIIIAVFCAKYRKMSEEKKTIEETLQSYIKEEIAFYQEFLEREESDQNDLSEMMVFFQDRQQSSALPDIRIFWETRLIPYYWSVKQTGIGADQMHSVFHAIGKDLETLSEEDIPLDADLSELDEKWKSLLLASILETGGAWFEMGHADDEDREEQKENQERLLTEYVRQQMKCEAEDELHFEKINTNLVMREERRWYARIEEITYQVSGNESINAEVCVFCFYENDESQMPGCELCFMNKK